MEIILFLILVVLIIIARNIKLLSEKIPKKEELKELFNSKDEE